jgi:hypothetical protein
VGDHFGLSECPGELQDEIQLIFNFRLLQRDCRAFVVNPCDPSRRTHTTVAHPLDFLPVLFDFFFVMFSG